MKRFTDSRFAIGVAGLLVSVCFVYLVFTKEVPFTAGYQVEGIFSSSNGLRKGSPVRVAGVDVGEVAGLDRGPGQTARVTLELTDEARPVHADATLRIRPRLFLEGGFFVEMEPGSPSAPELVDGDTIGLPQTAVPVQFHQVLTAFDRPARESIADLLTELDVALQGGGAEALGRAQKPLAPALRDLSIVAEAARGREPGDVAATVDATSRVTAALARRDEELGALVGNLRATAGALARNDQALAASVRGLDTTLAEAPAALRAIDRALPPTEAFADELEPSLPIAPGVLRATPPFLRQVEAISRRPEAPRTLDALEPTLDVLPRLERRLRALLPRVGSVTDCVRDRALPVLTAAVQDGEHTTGRPVWQELAHLTVGLASVSQTFDANGHALRYNLGGGPESVSLGSGSGARALQGQAEGVLLGSRPLWLGPDRRPPLNPVAPCREQAPVDLSARTGGSTRVRSGRASTRKPGRLTRTGLRSLIRNAEVRKAGGGR